MVKKILSLCIILTLTLCSLPSLSIVTQAAVNQPTLIYNDMSTNITQFGGSFLDSSYSKKFTVTDGSEPVGTYLQHMCSALNDGKAGSTGIRLGQRLQAQQGDFWVAEYWVRAYSAEGSEVLPQVYGNMQYTKDANSGSSGLNDINSTGYISLENGKWHKRYQIFEISQTTTGLTTGDITGIRFVLSSGKYVGQITHLGDLSLYSFPSDYTFGNLTGADAVKAYIENTSLSVIYNSGTAIGGFLPDVYDYTVATGSLGLVTAESENVYADILADTSEHRKVLLTASAYPYNNGAPTVYNASSVIKQTYTIAEAVPVKSMLADGYDLTWWEVGSKGNAIGGAPTIVNEDGKVALKYDTKDSAAGTSTGATFRAQTLAKAIKNYDELAEGDRVYLRFKAKGHSRYNNQCKIQLGIEELTTAGGTLGWITNTTTINIDGVWRDYYAILNITGAAENGARIRMGVGYKGQTTYLTDIELYKCSPDVENTDIINYMNTGIESMNKGKVMVLSGAGTGDVQRGTVEKLTSLPAEPPIELSDAYKFTSTEYTNTNNAKNDINYYKARLNSSNVYSHTANPGDKLLVTYWAYGEYTGTEEGTTAMMRPEVQASVGGANGSFAGYYNADGNVVSNAISVPSEWRRYAHVFEIPESDGYDMQINWYIGKVNQSIIFADVELYNLGAISAQEALGYLDDTDAKLFYKSQPMKLSTDGIYTAYAANGETSFDASDFTAEGVNMFTASRLVSYPDAIGESGEFELIAPNGNTTTVTFTLEELEKISADGRFFDSSKKAILKFDDYWADSEKFRPAVETVKKHGMKVGLGVSGEKWLNASDEEWAQLKEWSDDPDIEIWHHGYEHESEEYSTNTYSQQLESFKNTMELMRAHGIELTSFGSPLNNSTLVTAQMIHENFPEITNTMLSADYSVYQSGAIINFDNRVDIEAAKESGQNKTGVLNLEVFRANLDKASFDEVIVIQGHASMWDEAEIADLDLALSYIEEKGIITVLPSEYATSLRANEEVVSFGSTSVRGEAVVKSGIADVMEFDLIFAVYDEASDELTGIDVINVTLEPFEEKTVSLANLIPADGKDYCAKVFAWNSLDGAVPLGKCDVSGN